MQSGYRHDSWRRRLKHTHAPYLPQTPYPAGAGTLPRWASTLLPPPSQSHCRLGLWMPAYSALASGGAVRPPRAACLLLASFAAGSGLWLLLGSQKEEQPDVASPRTQRSARSAAQLAKWFRWQAVLASEAAAHTASPGKGSLALWGE